MKGRVHLKFPLSHLDFKLLLAASKKIIKRGGGGGGGAVPNQVKNVPFGYFYPTWDGLFCALLS